MSRGTQEIPRVKLHFAYRTITVYGQPFHTVPLYIFNPMSGSYNPGKASLTGLGYSAFARRYSQNLN